MSTQTIQIDQFLLNKLQPEIDRLNMSLISMEENGYDNKAMRLTRGKLNKLIPIHDFLKEYAYGVEEVDDATLTSIMNLIGTNKLSNNSTQRIIPSTRDSLDINNTTCLDFIRIYKDGEILRSSLLYPSTSPVLLQVYAPETTTEIAVTVYMTGSEPTTYVGTNNVFIDEINIATISEFYMEIVTKNICGETTSITKDLTINNSNCITPTYWIGSTTERFTIGSTDINETSDITINPNEGSNITGTRLTYNWIISNTDVMTEYVFAGDTSQTIEIAAGDAHALLLLPEIYNIASVHEVVGETKALMIQGLHYETFTIINSESLVFTCMYLRDLTDFTLSERSILIEIKEL